jgi:malonate transporter
VPYFSLIFIGFACGKAKALPEAGLAWMNFFLLYVSLPALLYGIMAKTPFSHLNNPPFLIATTSATMIAFVLAMAAGRFIGGLSFREATLAGLSGAYGNIGYMGPGLALAVLGAKAAAPTALIFCCDSIFLFSIVPLLIALTDRQHPSLLHTLGVVARQIVLNPLIMSACAGALAAAVHLRLPVAIDITLLFLTNAAAPVALFVLGVTVALRPFGRMPWEVPGVIAVKLQIHPLAVFGLMLLAGPFGHGRRPRCCWRRYRPRSTCS